MPQNKEVHAKYMRDYRRKGSQDNQGSQDEGSQQTEGSQVTVVEGSHKIMFNDDSSVLDLELLYNRKDKIGQLLDYLNSSDKTRRLLPHIRYGVYGPTLDRVNMVLSYLP